jgi:15-cis-phytoene synthase
VRDRDLVRLYWPIGVRPAFDALFAIDDAMGDVVATASQPALAAIKLAWWREALERLDHAPAPAEPRLQAAASELLPRGLSGRDLAELEEGWAAILGEVPATGAALQRGARLFGMGAQLLGGTADERLAEAGRVFAAGGLRRRGIRIPDGAVAARLTRGPSVLRPLTMLAALALRDLRVLEPEATPARSWTILRHRLTGR